MITLANLKDTTRYRKNVQRVGRGPGSNRGKTSGRGHKGMKSRSGYKRYWGYEGGQFRVFMKLPIRGFSNAHFRKAYDTINLRQVEAAYEDGEVVNVQTLGERGFLSGMTYGIKILGDGEITKKVTFEVAALSRTAQEKLQRAGISYTLV